MAISSIRVFTTEPSSYFPIISSFELLSVIIPGYFIRIFPVRLIKINENRIAISLCNFMIHWNAIQKRLSIAPRRLIMFSFLMRNSNLFVLLTFANPQKQERNENSSRRTQCNWQREKISAKSNKPLRFVGRYFTLNFVPFVAVAAAMRKAQAIQVDVSSMCLCVPVHIIKC